MDDDVFEAAKALAHASNQQLGTILSALARRGLKANASSVAPSGLPTFTVRPDAPIIPSDRASELLAEDPA